MATLLGPNVCLCGDAASGADREQAGRQAGQQCGDRQRQEGGGGGGGGGDAKRSRCNVSAVPVSAGLSGCTAGRALLASSTPIFDPEFCFIHIYIFVQVI